MIGQLLVSSDFVSGIFANICWHISILVKMGLQQQTLYEGQQAVICIF